MLISQPLLQFQRRQEGPDGGVGSLDEKLENFMTAWDNGGHEILNYLSAVYVTI